jgi:hypothetical protein
MPKLSKDIPETDSSRTQFLHIFIDLRIVPDGKRGPIEGV